MMQAEDYIKHCLYYKGEEKWVEFNIQCPEYLKGCIVEYRRSGLSEFSKEDNIPISLKSILFNRYMHWSGGFDHESDILCFKKWYISHYLEQ